MSEFTEPIATKSKLVIGNVLVHEHSRASQKRRQKKKISRLKLSCRSARKRKMIYRNWHCRGLIEYCLSNFLKPTRKSKINKNLTFISYKKKTDHKKYTTGVQ